MPLVDPSIGFVRKTPRTRTWDVRDNLKQTRLDSIRLASVVRLSDPSLFLALRGAELSDKFQSFVLRLILRRGAPRPH